MGYYGKKPCFPNPSWPLKLAPPPLSPPPKHPPEAALGAAEQGHRAPSPRRLSAAAPRTWRGLVLRPGVRPGGAASDLGSEGRWNRLGGAPRLLGAGGVGKRTPPKEKDLRTTGQEPSCIDEKERRPSQSNSAKHHAFRDSGPQPSVASRQAQAQDPPPQQGTQSSEPGVQEASVRLQGVRNFL